MRKNVTLGVGIILIGIIWLLSNLDVFSFSVIDVFFRSLAKLWPLLLIGVGVSILLKENSVLKLLLWLIIFISILIYGIYGVNSGTFRNGYLPSDYDYSESRDYSISKEAATEEGELNLSFGAGEVHFASTDVNLLQFKSNVPGMRYDHSFQDGEKKAVIDFDEIDFSIKRNDGKLFCNLDLHKDVTWEMDLDLGSAKGDLDFKDLAVQKLNLDVGAADLDLRLGNKYAQTDIEINAGASNIDIYVPQNAELKIKLNSALSANNISNLGLEKNGDYHISPDFESKAVKLVFEVEVGVGNISFHPE